jgi:hypothetical protein
MKQLTISRKQVKCSHAAVQWLMSFIVAPFTVNGKQYNQEALGPAHL